MIPSPELTPEEREKVPSSPSEPSQVEIWACRVMFMLYLHVLLLGLALAPFSILALGWSMIEAAGLIRQVVVTQSLGSVSEEQWLSYCGLGLLMVGLFLLPQYFRRHSRRTILLSPFALWALTLAHAVGCVMWAVYF